MVTKAAIDKLTSRIEALASLIDPIAGAVLVAVFEGETPEFALERHCELRPEHRGRRVQYDRRPNRREELHELAAVWAGPTLADFEEFRRSIEEPGFQKPVGVDFVEDSDRHHESGNSSL